MMQLCIFKSRAQACSLIETPNSVDIGLAALQVRGEGIVTQPPGGVTAGSGVAVAEPPIAVQRLLVL
jgi:hypothetical protein